MSDKKQQWCWYYDETVMQGPFKSREAARDDWLESYDEGEQEPAFAPIRWLDPVKHAEAAVDINVLLDDMDEIAHDDEDVYPDGPIFEVKGDKESHAKAEYQLIDLVGKWAKKWVVCNVFVPVEENEDGIVDEEAEGAERA